MLGEVADNNYLDIIRDFLESKGLGYNSSLTLEIEKRKRKEIFDTGSHSRLDLFIVDQSD